MKEIKTLQQCKELAGEEIFGTEFQFIHAAYANNDETRADLLYKATDRAAELYADQFKPEWIPVSDRLPEYGHLLDLWHSISKKAIYEMPWNEGDGPMPDSFTHWKYSTPPPEQ